MQFWVAGGDRRDPRVGLAAARRLPRRRRGADRRDHGRRASASSSAAPAFSASQAELWPNWRYFPFITNRTEPLRGGRGRAPPARGRRDPHRRPQGPGARALSLRQLRGQRRLDGDRLPCPQPRAVDRDARPWRPDPAHGPDDPPLARRPPGPAHPHRAEMDASPASPLALAAQVHRGADPDQGARHRGLSAPSARRHIPTNHRPLQAARIDPAGSQDGVRARGRGLARSRAQLRARSPRDVREPAGSASRSVDRG